MAFKGRVNRKSRSDRNHVIYEIINKSTGDNYIGLTIVRPPTKALTRSKMPLKSANDRFTSHCYRASKGSTTLLHQNIKEFGPEAFTVKVVEVIRGKSKAHEREIQLMHIKKPTLNMESMGRKNY